MDTTFVLQKEELTADFIENVKNIFKKSRLLQITISDSEDFDLYKKETEIEYFARLENAINSLETNKLSFTENEFDAITSVNSL